MDDANDESAHHLYIDGVLDFSLHRLDALRLSGYSPLAVDAAI